MGHTTTARFTHAKEREPAGLGWRSHTLFVLSIVAVGLFTDGFLYNLVIPVLPFMLEDGLNVVPAEIQSYTSAMLAVFAASTVLASPVAGILADKVTSRRWPYLFALSCLLGATLMLLFGGSIAVMIVARVLQGISCAFVWTIGLAMCLEAVGVDNMGKSMGTIFSVTAVGSLCAPFLGGALYQKAGLHGIAAVAIAVLGIDLVMRLLVIEKRAAKTTDDNSYYSKQFDDGQGDLDQEANPERQPLINCRHCRDEDFELSDDQTHIARTIPLLPCLANSSLRVALLALLAQAILMGNFDSTIAVIAKEMFDSDPFQAGLLFLPMGVTSVVCGPLIGWTIDRHGTKIAAVCSFGLLAPVLACLRYVHTGGPSQVVLYASLLTLAGIGLAGSGTPSIVEASAVIDKYHKANPKFFGANGPYAMVYGMNAMAFNAGLTMGPELAALLKDSIGYGNMNLVLAVLSGVTGCLCYFYLGGKPRAWMGNRDQT